jgi:hypothetical protein
MLDGGLQVTSDEVQREKQTFEVGSEVYLRCREKSCGQSHQESAK